MSQIPAVIDPRGAFVRKMIEDCGIPTFHIRANQKCVGVKINGKNRCLIEKNSFGLLKCAIRNLGAREVTDALAQYQFSIVMNVGFDVVALELVHPRGKPADMDIRESRIGDHQPPWRSASSAKPIMNSAGRC